MKIDFIDVKRAYLFAEARREVYVTLPEEDSEPGMCGMLKKAMYGTRDAAQNWEYEYTEFLEGAGFTRGKASPCAFLHEERKLRLVVHGDDFTILGKAKDLDWFREKVQGRYEVKFRGRMGPEKEDTKSMRLLNRIIQWNEEGIQYEADQRHAEIIVREMGIKQGKKDIVTPGTKGESKEEDQRELDAFHATKYRAMTARGNYLAQDRSDIQFAVKELIRGMAKPTWEDWNNLKRLARYLRGKPRAVLKYDYQSEGRKLTVWSDTDFAGCRK